MSKFNKLIGGSVLNESWKKNNIGPFPVHLEMENSVESYFIRERRAYIESIGKIAVHVRKPDTRVIYPSVATPLPRIRELNISGALPYFYLVVGFLLAVGGWFWWFFVR